MYEWAAEKVVMTFSVALAGLGEPYVRRPNSLLNFCMG